MLLDVCKELLEDVRNGWEYREIENEENLENGNYILETLKYEYGITVYHCLVIESNGEQREGGSILLRNKEDLMRCNAEDLKELCNQSYYYNVV